MARDWEFARVAGDESSDVIAEQAAQRFSSGGQGEVSSRTLAESVSAIVSGRAEHSCVAVQDSLGGEGRGLLDALGAAPGVFVVGEVMTELRACLMALPDVNMAGIRTVVGRREMLDAVAEELAALPVELRATRDVAFEARLISERDDRKTALLAPPELAEGLRLGVLRADLGDEQEHWVRHWVLGQAQSVPAESGTRSAFLLGPVFGARTLKTLRMDLQSRGASRVHIADRRGQVGEEFLVEFDHEQGLGEVTMFEAARFCRFRHLGSWTPDTSVLASAA